MSSLDVFEFYFEEVPAAKILYKLNKRRKKHGKNSK